MPSILNLKFKGNKSFVAFSNLGDTESLTKTWKVCTKVASYLEQGQRLENLSWRLWHLQNLMVDTDNAKSKREFKKLSKCMGDKLDKEKGRNIQDLEAPDFKRNHSTDMLRQRAVEKERSREASQNAKPGTIKRMQFTFSVDQPAPAASTYVKKPDMKPSPEFNKRAKTAVRSSNDDGDDMVVGDHDANDKDPPLTHRGRKQASDTTSEPQPQSQSLRFPSIFNNDFGPSALLYPRPTLTTRMNYGESTGANASSSYDGFSIPRPTIELPLDELLHNVDSADSADGWPSPRSSNNSDPRNDEMDFQQPFQDVSMQSISTSHFPRFDMPKRDMEEDSSESEDESEFSYDLFSTLSAVPPISQAVKEVLPQTISPSKMFASNRASTPTGRPALTVRTQTNSNANRSSGLAATATSLNPAVLRHPTSHAPNNSNSNSNSAPGGVKAECSNCGATHTPLWRRGLNDELNCNACGLYCKLHKRPRPKSMRTSHGEGRAQVPTRQETVDIMAQCYNCHTTATPLWRKDDEGKTVCNACGLYYKLHGSARPISMKSDVIRKRSRHDARRMGGGPDTPSASPGVSRRATPSRELSPTLAPDSTTQMTYEYNDEGEYRSSQSELMGALGQDSQQHHHNHSYTSSFLSSQFPGPYHPDYLTQYYNPAAEALPFAEESDVDGSNMHHSQDSESRINKRRRMSVDSASEPPSSAASYGSYNTDGYSSSATSHSHRSSFSTDFPFSSYPSASYISNNNSGSALRGSGGNAFWHPPMMPQGGENSPQGFHPPMLPPTEDSPMDYLHPPMLPQDEDALFSTYLHPPMTLPDDSNMHPHPPMFPSDDSMGHSYAYEHNMRIY